ncbi:hypothetical protein BD779DRAFT_919404 [Infundibulicybe gibba]|nr:hypothetical protein BD779DRAFT_919404 [Infundibulicybe gibba]
MSGFFQRSAKYLRTLTLTNIPRSRRWTYYMLHVRTISCFPRHPLRVESHEDEVNLDELLRALNANLPGMSSPPSLPLLWGNMHTSEEALGGVIASRRDIDPTNDGVALLEDLTLECAILPSQPTSRGFQHFVSGVSVSWIGGIGVYIILLRLIVLNLLWR